jgi:aspartate-semialdehyde dehydrogenase
MAFLKADIPVFSNAKNYRMHELVPLIVPLANSDHIALVQEQRKSFGVQKGFIVTNANCASTGLCVALYPLFQKYGLKEMIVHTMQAISGAGYPGCSSLDILDNVVPYISGEEEKVETEPQKILGTLKQHADFRVSASCNRVPVIDGHTENIMLRFEKLPCEKDKKKMVEEVKKTLREYESEAQKLQLFSAPRTAILVREEADRPQPRLDRDFEKGQGVVVGRIRPCSLFDVKLTLLSHNTILGAAGSALLNAELAIAKGLV